MKICIIGYSGAGKSTLAKKLSQFYNCPVMFLDKVNFMANWQERDLTEGLEIVEKFLENESWVIDGNYKKFNREKRLKQADTIIFLDYPRRICLFQALKRYFTNKGKSRESIADGCIEKFDFEFLLWILFDGRNSSHKKAYKNIIDTYNDKTIVFHNGKQLDSYLDKLIKPV